MQATSIVHTVYPDECSLSLVRWGALGSIESRIRFSQFVDTNKGGRRYVAALDHRMGKRDREVSNIVKRSR